MRNFIDEKRRLLTDYFINRKIINIQNNDQDSTDKIQNKSYDKSTPWKVLLEDSKDMHPKISVYSMDDVYMGLIFDDTLSSNIYRAAMKKILPNIMVEFDSDDQEQILEKIIYYITSNNLHKKSFHNLIKSLKNLNIDLLSEE